MEEVSSLLKDANLQLSEYQEKFEKNGYDDLVQIIEMTDEDVLELLEHVGLNDKPGHKKRFLAALDIYKSKSKAGLSPIEIPEASVGESFDSMMKSKNDLEISSTLSKNDADSCHQTRKPLSALCKYQDIS